MVCVEYAVVARNLLDDQLGHCEDVRSVKLVYDDDGDSYSVVVTCRRGAKVDVPDHFDNVPVHVREVD